jgi:hypothetical protein
LTGIVKHISFVKNSVSNNLKQSNMKNQNQKIKFQDWNCLLEFGEYQNNGRTAITLIDENDGSPITTATINLPNVSLNDDEVIIKDYSENEGILNILLINGVVELTGKSVDTGFVNCEICKLIK